MMTFDFDGALPIYMQVAVQIEEGILQGSFKEGEQVPSTTEISKRFNINPATVLKGMNLLVTEGVLEKRRGLGMFVTAEGLDILYKKRKESFLKEQLAQVIDEAKRLGIEKDDLLRIIEEGY
ncbi:GntR family transcriptional regulator [Vagococcus acidifermentans]|uniref:GntR family transcriptional regulator n=2 Tax=Vagococcus acidifermentans TaxID=564710 RepID=A0A430B0H0_9ENTE|nr:GntR family transcriptional regulator [Vagococcus acidifermentans]